MNNQSCRYSFNQNPFLSTFLQIITIKFLLSRAKSTISFSFSTFPIQFHISIFLLLFVIRVLHFLFLILLTTCSFPSIGRLNNLSISLYLLLSFLSPSASSSILPPPLPKLVNHLLSYQNLTTPNYNQHQIFVPTKTFHLILHVIEIAHPTVYCIFVQYHRS